MTHYHVCERFADASLVQVKLETGRTHQIRVHFSALGWPVLGDRDYGRAAPTAAIDRQALHATRLAFPHPLTKQLLTFESEPPADMQQLLKILRTR